MILVDTSVWIDHLRRRDPILTELLGGSAVLRHPMVVGELAVGSLADRATVLGAMAGLPAIAVATHDEVLALVEARALHGRGLSLIDVYLLASVLLVPGTLLWTRDKRLEAASVELGLGYSPGH